MKKTSSWLKIIGVIFIIGVLTYFLTVYVLTGLKIQGYRYLFRATEPYDLVIKHARILDGTGENEPFRGDIAVRDGYIVGVGYVNPKNSPVFDAGGLTIMPYQVDINPREKTVEHSLKTSYPRYLAEEIFFKNEPYQGLNLSQVSEILSLTPKDAVLYLNQLWGDESKVLLVSVPFKNEDKSNKEFLARLTGYRAQYYGYDDRGTVRKGSRADFYIFKTDSLNEEVLNELLRKGRLPEPVYRVERGVFLNQ